MKKLLRFFVLQINGLFPFLYHMRHIVRRFNFFRGIFAYWRDFILYKLKRKRGAPFPLKFIDTYPCLYDRYEDAGTLPRHYFHQDIWAAGKVYKTGIKLHYDIGSRLDGFIAHCLTFTSVVMLDIRPLKSKVKNLKFIKCDATDMKTIKSGSLKSVSTLHAVEHFGLGRYGDPIDPEGHLKVIGELKRVVAKGGDLYFAVPVGKEKLEFNSYRVFDPESIVRLFDGFQLVEFSAVDDKNQLIEKISPRKVANSDYACGLYHFRKKAVSSKN